MDNALQTELPIAIANLATKEDVNEVYKELSILRQQNQELTERVNHFEIRCRLLEEEMELQSREIKGKHIIFSIPNDAVNGVDTQKRIQTITTLLLDNQTQHMPEAIKLSENTKVMKFKLNTGSNETATRMLKKVCLVCPLSSPSPPKEHFLDQIVKKRLPTVAPTRWNYLSRLVNVVQIHLSDLVTLFEEMIDDPDTWGADAIQARGFLQFLKSFNTVFMLNTFNDIFVHTDNLFNVLQNKMFDIHFCCEQIESVKFQINNLRTRFQHIFGASKNGMDPVPKRGESQENFELRYRQFFKWKRGSSR